MALRESPTVAHADDEQDLAVSVSEAARNAVVALEKKGRLTPRAVVEAARDPNSPMHACFEWDDSVAGDKWRIEQARRLIRTVRIVYEEEVIVFPRRYVPDPATEADEPGYVSVAQVRKEPKNAAALLRYEFTRAAAHCRRALAIADVVGVSDETAKIVESIEKLLRKFE